MKFLIIDNYDSFVYNIAQYLGELGVNCDVIRNDKITVQQIKQKNYDVFEITDLSKENLIISSLMPGLFIDKKWLMLPKHFDCKLGTSEVLCCRRDYFPGYDIGQSKVHIDIGT